MENEEKIKKLTTEESFDRVFEELEALSGCFEPEGKKIILGKIRNLEESFKTESEMKIVLHELCTSIKEKSITLKTFLVKKTAEFKYYIAKKFTAYQKKRYFKNKAKNQKHREKYES